MFAKQSVVNFELGSRAVIKKGKKIIYYFITRHWNTDQRVLPKYTNCLFDHSLKYILVWGSINTKGLVWGNRGVQT